MRDSHDRYANVEINYLLQRMGDYAGLAILATNRRAALDGALVRRLPEERSESRTHASLNVPGGRGGGVPVGRCGSPASG